GPRVRGGGDPELRGPRHAAVVRAQHREVLLVVVRDEDAPGREHDRLHPGGEGAADRDAAREAGCGRRIRPRQARVRRGLRHDHLADDVAVAQVAVAVERALRPVVAGDPLLVLAEGAARGDRGHRATPVEAVARAVDPQRRAAGAEDERDREPDAVSAVVHHGRVAGAWAEAGEEAALPAPAGVAGDGEADRVRAPVEDPADLEDRDDGLAERERVGLDLGRVPALARAERIARGAPGDDLAVAGDAGEVGDWA